MAQETAVRARGGSRGLVMLLGVLLLLGVIGWLLSDGVVVQGHRTLGPGLVGPGLLRGHAVLGWAWGLLALGLLARLFIWGALLVGLILLIRWAVDGAGPRGEVTADSALEILRRRYAAGEITQEQYEQMRRVLQP